MEQAYGLIDSSTSQLAQGITLTYLSGRSTRLCLLGLRQLLCSMRKRSFENKRFNYPAATNPAMTP